MKDFMKANPDSEKKYNEVIKTYEFSNGIPKYKMFVKMNNSISVERRDFIANGIRSFFKDDQTILLDLQVAMQAVTSSLALF